MRRTRRRRRRGASAPRLDGGLPRQGWPSAGRRRAGCLDHDDGGQGQDRHRQDARRRQGSVCRPLAAESQGAEHDGHPGGHIRGVLPATSIAPTATIPPEASSAVHSLTDQVRHAIGGLPGLPTAPLPSPSVPPVPGVGSVQTVIPVPSVIPLVPSVVPTPGG